MILKLSIFIIAIDILCACAPETLHMYRVPAEVAPLIEQFKAEAAAHGHSLIIENLVVQFSDALPLWEPGSCTTSSSTPLINLNRIFWFESSTAAQREEVVYHELGHCVLGRPHLDLYLNGVSVSLMSTELLPESWYTNNRAYYIFELFNR